MNWEKIIDSLVGGIFGAVDFLILLGVRWLVGFEIAVLVAFATAFGMLFEIKEKLYG